jgi:flagellar biosynthesis protein FlgN
MSNTNIPNRIPALCTQLKLLLEKDLTDISNLRATLTEEASALKERDSEKISHLAKNKGTLVKQIEDRARAKVKLITASGAQIEAGKVKSGIEALGDADLTKLWNDSLAQLEDCKQQNQINGLIIERSRARNQKIMDIVRGQHTKPKLYGNTGSEQAYSSATSIAKA